MKMMKIEELMTTPVVNSIDEVPIVAHNIIAKMNFYTAIEKLSAYHYICWQLEADYLLNEYADL